MKLVLVSLFFVAAISVVSGQEKTPATAPPAPAPAAPTKGPAPRRTPRKVKIEMRDGLQFDPPRFMATPGEEIVVTLENADSSHQAHNFLVVQPGQLTPVVQAAMALGESGPAQQFVPPLPEILVHSAVIDPEKSSEIRFTLPSAPGVYPYVCTMPGHGMVMFGAIYAGVAMPPLDKDPNIPPQAVARVIAGGGQRPYVQRVFMPESGPASIAVALPGDQNFCWDAGECRLRYAWRGLFVDASAHWKGNGKDLAKLPVPAWWTAEKRAAPWRLGSPDGAALKVKFLGYRMEGGLPEFHYRVGGLEVFEKISAAAAPAALAVRFRIPNAAQPIFLRLGGAGGTWTSSAGSWDAEVLSLTAKEAAEFTLTLTASK